MNPAACCNDFAAWFSGHTLPDTLIAPAGILLRSLNKSAELRYGKIQLGVSDGIYDAFIDQLGSCWRDCFHFFV